MSHPYLTPVVRLVTNAGAAALPYWRNNTAVEIKADNSPLTAADLAVHHLLVAGLQSIAPNIPVLSEEAADISLAERSAWSQWWLIDPLDGTKEFIAGSDEFTVNVALIDQGVVVFGVVGIPVQGTCYFGGAAFGAGQVDATGTTLTLQVRNSPPEQFTVVASKRHSSPQEEQLHTSLRGHFKDPAYKSVGSSLKFCLVAEGSADCYWRLTPTAQWDTAAAQGVLEGAGGKVLNLETMQPLAYVARTSFINPCFVALPQAAPWEKILLPLLASTLKEAVPTAITKN